MFPRPNASLLEFTLSRCVSPQMFALLSGLWKYLFQKDEYFVLILGLDNAGKTVSNICPSNKN